MHIPSGDYLDDPEVRAGHDQAWFWTPEWQAKEAEADQEIADGGGPVMSEDEFLADLADRAAIAPGELA